MAQDLGNINGGDEADTSNSGDESLSADEIEDSEWDSAIEDFAPGVLKKEVEKDEQADTTTETTTEAPKGPETTTETTTIDPNETDAEKADREKLAADADAGDDKSEEETNAEQSTRTARQIQREASKQVEEVAVDVRAKMFADQPTELVDGDGDPIKSIADVMKLMNPNTNEAFTEEEAGQWLLAAQQQLNQNLAATDKQINQIAEVNVDLKDQVDSINYQYGELLKSMPDLRDQIWAQYEKTLVKDSASGIITSMPIPIEDYYDTVLQPYVKLAESLEAQEADRLESEKAQKAVQKKASRIDRSEIFGAGRVDDMDDEEQEWADAAKSYYES